MIFKPELQLKVLIRRYSRRGKIMLLFEILFYCISICSGQSIVRSSLNSLGSASKAGNMIIRQTTGQSSITSVGQNGKTILRQGFQQPVATKRSETEENQVLFSLWPNPAHETTILEIDGEISKYSIKIISIQGTLMTLIKDQTSGFKQLDLNNYQQGIYIVTVSSGAKSSSLKLIVGQ